MKSGAAYHFPPVVLRQGTKVLWNRFGKKPLVNRPEERVRLRYLDYLTLECGWPGSRIAVESPVNRTKRGSQTRADLVCHDKQLNPSILIECKSEFVKLGQNAAEQIANYNQTVNVSLLCITNGMSDFWFELKEENLHNLETPAVESKRHISDIRSGLRYWEERGFTGRKPISDNNFWISDTLKTFWAIDRPWQSRFLDIHHKVEALEVNHYYRLTETSDGNRIAMSFMAGFDDNTYLVAILNKDGQNRALMVSNLNDAAKKQNDNTLLVTASGNYHINIRKKIPLNFSDHSAGVIYQLPGFIESLIQQKL